MELNQLLLPSEYLSLRCMYLHKTQSPERKEEKHDIPNMLTLTPLRDAWALFFPINCNTAVKFIIFPWAQLRYSWHWVSPTIMLPVQLLLLGVTKVTASSSLNVCHPYIIVLPNSRLQMRVLNTIYSIKLVGISALGFCCADHLCFTYFHRQLPNYYGFSHPFSLSPELLRFAAGFFWEHLPGHGFSIW